MTTSATEIKNAPYSVGSTIRLGNQPGYYIYQFQQFANLVCVGNISSVHFGKQDSRGVPSISLMDVSGCISAQEHLGTNKELLAFVCGYVMAKSKCDSFVNENF